MSGELPFCASVRVRTAPHFTVVPLPLVLLPSSDSLVSWPPSFVPWSLLMFHASSPRPLVHVPSCMIPVHSVPLCTYIPTPFLLIHTPSCIYISHTTLHSFRCFPFPYAVLCSVSRQVPYSPPALNYRFQHMLCWHLAWVSFRLILFGFPSAR